MLLQDLFPARQSISSAHELISAGLTKLKGEYKANMQESPAMARPPDRDTKEEVLTAEQLKQLRHSLAHLSQQHVEERKFGCGSLQPSEFVSLAVQIRISSLGCVSETSALARARISFNYAASATAP
jgi:hypothetical protein